MRILRPTPNVYAFYEGRDGRRAMEGPNWIDDGALSLGIASYAIVAGDEALIYDTHVSIEHAQFVRDTLEADGITRFTVLLSHWHLDHIAGTVAFADCEIWSTARTAELMTEHRAAIEAGTQSGPPGIAPLVLPTRTFHEQTVLMLGETELHLMPVDIHSDDAAVVWLPEQELLLAGDTMEDTITYVAEPGHLERHLVDLDRLLHLRPAAILPNHGHPDVIAGGGYPPGLNLATQQYIRALLRMPGDPALAASDLRELIAGPLVAGWIHWFAPYEAVHRGNVENVVGTGPAL